MKTTLKEYQHDRVFDMPEEGYELYKFLWKFDDCQIKISLRRTATIPDDGRIHGEPGELIWKGKWAEVKRVKKDPRENPGITLNKPSKKYYIFPYDDSYNGNGFFEEVTVHNAQFKKLVLH